MLLWRLRASKTVPKQAGSSTPAVGGAYRTDPARHGSMAGRNNHIQGLSNHVRRE
jgi:hypothetical protein